MLGARSCCCKQPMARADRHAGMQAVGRTSSVLSGAPMLQQWSVDAGSDRLRGIFQTEGCRQTQARQLPARGTAKQAVCSPLLPAATRPPALPASVKAGVGGVQPCLRSYRRHPLLQQRRGIQLAAKPAIDVVQC